MCGCESVCPCEGEGEWVYLICEFDSDISGSATNDSSWV